ncbi:hypothetical protein [Hoyosella altamirensis]|uniref:DUF559 domain-containing protein n=1 Tax=Hoyosella altamirensis TaxID=616997 RepID=A0A839RK26_9ACTN|nr:hypothetical protein [Hoyosella altamirensis]MBB3037015.1 hypothetical protein [Hoyosella altamirensis]
MTTPRSTSPVRRRGVQVRHRDLHTADLTMHRHLPLTALPLTVIEAAVLLDDAAVVDRALQQRIVTLGELDSAHERNKGRRGSKTAAKLLKTARSGGASEGERLLHRLLREAGITGWKPHVRACGFEIDVAFDTQRVAIEVDGWAWHAAFCDMYTRRAGVNITKRRYARPRCAAVLTSSRDMEIGGYLQSV